MRRRSESWGRFRIFLMSVSMTCLVGTVALMLSTHTDTLLWELADSVDTQVILACRNERVTFYYDRYIGPANVAEHTRAYIRNSCKAYRRYMVAKFMPCRAAAHSFRKEKVVAVSMWWLIIATSIYPALACGVVIRLLNRKAARKCLCCGYRLHGLTEPRCPECGTPFERKENHAQARKT